MHGAGTKPDTTIPDGRTRCLDLTRLISRAGWRLTGVDRVEMAYLTQLLGRSDPLFGLVHTSLGYVLLDRTGMAALARLFESNDWPKQDVLSRFTNRRAPYRQRAETALRRHALARCRPRGLDRMIRAHIPKDATYFNVGHSNLSARVFEAFAHTRRTVMIHDTIPLDHPHYQADGIPEAFAAKLRRVGTYADLILYNSAQSQRDTERYFREWGLAAKGVVALLGVTEPVFANGTWPAQVDPARPIFVTLGTIEPRKNHRLLLDVWDQFAQERALQDMPQLVIAGTRGWKNDDVFQRLDKKPPAVIELNSLPDPDLFTLLKKANALLFPSHAEGFGLPPAEAALIGTPVICGDLPVYREFLGDIPVYVDVNDGYLWKKAIELQLERAKDTTLSQAKSKRVALPTWTDHFNIVLRVA